MLTPMRYLPAFLHTQNRHRTLIIADLHLGWEINLVQKGIYLPSQMPKIRQKLLNLIDRSKAKTLIVLGDVKHTIAKAQSSEWRDIPEFFEAIRTKINDVQIIRGNHDGNIEPLLPPWMQLHPSSGIKLDDIAVFHGHTWPSKKVLDCRTLIMGHVHPTVALRDQLGFQMSLPALIRMKIHTEKLAGAFLKSKHIKVLNDPIITFLKHFNVRIKAKQLFILPCFNEFLGGRPINREPGHKRYVGPVLRSDCVELSKGEAYLLDGTYLGRIEQLRTLLQKTKKNSY